MDRRLKMLRQNRFDQILRFEKRNFGSTILPRRLTRSPIETPPVETITSPCSNALRSVSITEVSLRTRREEKENFTR